MASPASASSSYAVKTVSFYGRRVPVLQQNENGPCPLLALANALLLSGRLSLGEVGEYVDADWLVSQVANFLVEASVVVARGSPGGGGDRADAAASSVANEVALSAAIASLPTLLTGLDINPKFGDVSAMEFTPELSAFDISGLRLVHGWVVDPQEAVAPLIAELSYNVVMERLIASLATPGSLRLVKPLSSSSRRGMHSGRGFTSPPPLPPLGSTTEAARPLHAPSLLSIQEDAVPPHSPSAPSGAEPVPNAAAADSTTGAQSASTDDDIDLLSFSPPAASAPAVADGDQTQQAEFIGADALSSGAAAVALPPLPPPPPQSAVAPVSAPALEATPAEEGPDPRPHSRASDRQAGGGGGGTAPLLASPSASSTPTRGSSWGGSLAFPCRADAAAVDEWLQATASQLTISGLMGLHERLQPGELGIFFRNNHFTVIHKRPTATAAGAAGMAASSSAPACDIFLLVTDVGYHDVPQVVWERLDDIDETTLCSAEFTPSEVPAGSSGAVIAGGSTTSGSAGSPCHDHRGNPQPHRSGHPPHDDHASNADFLLAQSLQREEEHAAALEEAQHVQQQQRRQQQRQPPGTPHAGSSSGSGGNAGGGGLTITTGSSNASSSPSTTPLGAGATAAISTVATEAARGGSGAPSPSSGGVVAGRNDRYATQAAALKAAAQDRERRQLANAAQTASDGQVARHLDQQQHQREGRHHHAPEGQHGGGKKGDKGCAIC